MLHPSFESVRPGEESEFESIVPRYPVIKGVPQRILRKSIRQALQAIETWGDDPLPEGVRDRNDLPGEQDAYRGIHMPDSPEEAERARRRFVFEEVFRMQALFAIARKRRLAARSRFACSNERLSVHRFVRELPFTLTEDQKKVVGEICSDLESGHPMERLLLGDVGSGKTAVAAAAVAHVLEAGGQAAVLVPTEVLARQHEASFRQLFARSGMRVELLASDRPAPEKRRIREAIRSGVVRIAVGTHALIQDGTEFHNLALAVVDEQHRFGVKQRGALPAKGEGTHFLHLSATPIPRSLALTIYGDLDLSIIRTMPPGRKPVRTIQVSGKERRKAYETLKERVECGEQAFILFPLVEDSERVDLKAATSAWEKLRKGFLKDYRVELLHGRMAAAERAETLDRFRAGESDVLVCTTVIEVGVDLPRATVMIIEDADRFGLSQLHQIRGRVGRSELQSHCYLSTDGELTDHAQKRLAALERETDGFRIAEEDLAIRGPGDLLGIRQHGRYGLAVLGLLHDTELLEAARREAFNSDINLSTLSEPLRAG